MTLEVEDSFGSPVSMGSAQKRSKHTHQQSAPLDKENANPQQQRQQRIIKPPSFAEASWEPPRVVCSFFPPTKDATKEAVKKEGVMEGGLGLVIVNSKGDSKVVGMLSTGVAARSRKFLKGDIIVSVDGRDLRGQGPDAIVDLISSSTRPMVDFGLLRKTNDGTVQDVGVRFKKSEILSRGSESYVATHWRRKNWGLIKDSQRKHRYVKLSGNQVQVLHSTDPHSTVKQVIDLSAKDIEIVNLRQTAGFGEETNDTVGIRVPVQGSKSKCITYCFSDDSGAAAPQKLGKALFDMRARVIEQDEIVRDMVGTELQKPGATLRILQHNLHPSVQPQSSGKKRALSQR